MSEGINELLIELRKTYLGTLPAKISAIEKLWKSNDLRSLRTDFHKLKGTGRTYGLPEVSQIGEALERICLAERQDLLDQAVPLAIELLRDIQALREREIVPQIESGAPFQKIIELVTLLHD